VQGNRISVLFRGRLIESADDAAAIAVRFISVQTLPQSGNPADRRRDPRHAASGKVQLKFENHPRREVEADLMDIGASGFRARHRHGSLPLGANTAFRHAEGAGRARVVWNWMYPDHVETGFVIVR